MVHIKRGLNGDLKNNTRCIVPLLLDLGMYTEATVELPNDKRPPALFKLVLLLLILLLISSYPWLLCYFNIYPAEGYSFSYRDIWYELREENCYDNPFRSVSYINSFLMLS